MYDAIYDFVIERNNIITHDACGICEQATDPKGGFDIFVRCSKGKSRLVCASCIQKHAPDMQALLALGRAANTYAGLLARRESAAEEATCDLLRAARTYWRLAGEGQFAEETALWGPFNEDAGIAP